MQVHMCKKCLAIFNEEEVETTKVFRSVKQLDVDDFEYGWVDENCCPECESTLIKEVTTEELTKMFRDINDKAVNDKIKRSKYKITLTEFWNSSKKLVINCDTEEKAEKLCRAFHKLGKKWALNSNRSYDENNYWKTYKENNCYSNEGGFSSRAWYEKLCVKIYEFEEIDLEGYDN